MNSLGKYIYLLMGSLSSISVGVWYLSTIYGSSDGKQEPQLMTLKEFSLCALSVIGILAGLFAGLWSLISFLVFLLRRKKLADQRMSDET